MSGTRKKRRRTAGVVVKVGSVQFTVRVPLGQTIELNIDPATGTLSLESSPRRWGSDQIKVPQPSEAPRRRRRRRRRPIITPCPTWQAEQERHQRLRRTQRSVQEPTQLGRVNGRRYRDGRAKIKRAVKQYTQVWLAA
jgi:hypothetical protein